MPTRVTQGGAGFAVGALVLSLVAACGDDSTAPQGGGGPPPARPVLPATYRPSGHAADGDTFVHLFEWKWTDIANECETVLGPAGYKAVQVSPPQEHSITPSHDWSERYQPVSYSLARSRSGTQAEFVSMVQRCAAVGVGIYVDAVINHMTNFPSPGTGSNGTNYSKYTYPGLYSVVDFHSPCTVDDYQSAANVQDCELLSLPDLNTGSVSVQEKIAEYLLRLARIGVAGFRIDAAKHIQPVELDQIIDRVNNQLVAEALPLPYWFLEVSGANGEAVQPADYYGEGYGSGGAADITEFTFTGVGNKFSGLNGEHISQLNPNGSPGNQFSPEAWSLMPGNKAVVFLQNHDTQHNCGLSYRDPQTFRLANVWMLAEPYGYPSILSSYVFQCPGQNSLGPPSDADGWTLPVQCATSLETAPPGTWVCEHRDRYLSSMVRFRLRTVGTPVSNWWDNGGKAIAFSRGSLGFVAINRETAPVPYAVRTDMPSGTYCDLLSGGIDGSSCLGTSVVVSPNDSISFTLGANLAVAIDSSTRLPAPFRGTTH